MFTMPVPIVIRVVRPAMPATVVSASLLNTLSTMNTLSKPRASAMTARSTAGRALMPNPQNVTPRFIGSPSGARSVTAQTGNGQEKVKGAAKLVQTAHVPPREGIALLLREVGVAERATRVVCEARPIRGILLQPIQDDVQLVAAHGPLHSSAARSTRPISPKKRTRALPGLA